MCAIKCDVIFYIRYIHIVAAEVSDHMEKDVIFHAAYFFCNMYKHVISLIMTVFHILICNKANIETIFIKSEPFLIINI